MKINSPLFCGVGAFVLFAFGTARCAIPVSSDNGTFPLASQGEAAPIFTAPGDHKVVEIATADLAGDIEAISGLRPALSQGNPSGSRVILIGTIGKSSLIDSLIAGGKLDVASVRGKCESFVIQTLDNPLPGVDKALVIAGSDRRGTAFGVFDLSEGMGVSPWIWWADVAPAKKSELWVKVQRYEQGPPAVKYRGIFLNDEDWGLQPWAAKTYEPEVGDIGPKTYARIFELLLRLRANYLWPAMHNVTKAFNSFPENRQVADDYGIVMGSSHAEAMLRNNVGEWNTTTMGPWNYATNRTRIYQYWDERVQTNGAFENIYTVGIRGLHDSAIEGATTTVGKIALVESAFADQRQILANRVNPEVTKVPQVVVLYNEVLDLYKAGLRIPDDVTIMWPDDNQGYIRQLSGSSERTRSGGSGVYYHLSYWGPPEDYLWLCTTPPAVIWSEMSKAYDSGASTMWMVNVGDLKPAELCTQFFLELARDPEKFRNFNQRSYLDDWAERTFGAPLAASIGGILDRYYRLNHAVKPEHLNLKNSGFSHVKNGDEASRRLQDFAQLARDADALYSQVPGPLRSAYFELVLYPVRCSNLMNQKVLVAERSRLFAQQRRQSTASTSAAAIAAYNRIAAETASYNTATAGGKWNRMMYWHPRDRAAFSLPETGKYTPPADGPIGVAVEGSARTLDPGDSAALPPFTPYADDGRFIDVFGTGSKIRSWTARAGAPWINLSKTSGTTASDARLFVTVDWLKAPQGYSVSSPVLIADGESADREINVTIFNPPGLQKADVTGSVERNGAIEIEAEECDRTTDRGGVGWKRVPGLGASDDAMTPAPVLFAPFDVKNLKTTAPSLEYDFYTFDRGPMAIQTACLPSYPIDGATRLRLAIAVNDETPQVISANTGNWNVDSIRAASINHTVHQIASAGKQTLRIWAIDPATVVDKFMITAPPSKAATAEETDFGTESLAVADKTADIIFRTFDESGAARGRATILESQSNGQFVTLALPFVTAGAYDLSLRVKKLANRGIVQLAISDNANGPFVDFGEPFDLYNGTEIYAVIPPIRVTFATSGQKYLRFSVVGKNASATSAWICLDDLSLEPVRLAKLPLNLDRWRESFFGTAENSNGAADDADWDRDGCANLLEYAAGSYPTDSRSVPHLDLAGGPPVACRFARQAGAGDVLLAVQASDNLKTWESIWTSGSLPTSGGESVQNLEAMDPKPISGRRFYRLRADRR